MTPVRSDLLFGLSVLALSALLFFVVIPVGVDSPGEVRILALAPSFWPNVIDGFMGVIAIVIIGRACTQLMNKSGVPHEEESSEAAALPLKVAALRVISCFALCVLYYVLLEQLGFIAASIVIIGALSALAGEFRWYIVVPVALLLPTGLYLFFTRVAAVHLPLGLFDSMPALF